MSGSTRQTGHRRPRTWQDWCTATALLAAGVLAVGAFLVLTRLGQRIDAWPAGAFHLTGAAGVPVTTVLARYNPSAVAMVAGVSIVVAALRQRPDLGAAALAVLAGANVTTRLLKEIVPRPEHGITQGALILDNSAPSGHTTAAMSFLVALTFVAPAVIRPVVAAAGAGAVAAAGIGMVLVGAHRPGDIVSAVAVGLVWAAVAVWLSRTLRDRFGGSGGAHAYRVSVPDWLVPSTSAGMRETAVLSALAAVVVAVGMVTADALVPGRALLATATIIGLTLLSIGAAVHVARGAVHVD